MKNHRASEPQTPTDLLNDLRTLVVDAEKMLESSVSEHTDEAVSALRARYEAASDAERSLVTKLAKDVRGVNSVTNKMTVKG